MRKPDEKAKDKKETGNNLEILNKFKRLQISDTMNRYRLPPTIQINSIAGIGLGKYEDSLI